MGRAPRGATRGYGERRAQGARDADHRRARGDPPRSLRRRHRVRGVHRRDGHGAGASDHGGAHGAHG